jgi:precorrin-8X/cobalt-precorrin-8 methylmutase
VADERTLTAAHAALHAGVPVVADVAMVASGITGRSAVCRLADAQAGPGLTRSAHAIRLAYAQVGPGALWVIGCAPTALEELIALDAAPALVIGMPVGFVGAAESKALLRASGLPAVSNVSEKGGSAVAAAALNALLYTPYPAPETPAAPGPRAASGTPRAPGTPPAPSRPAAPGPPTANETPRAPGTPLASGTPPAPGPPTTPAPPATPKEPAPGFDHPKENAQ